MGSAYKLQLILQRSYQLCLIASIGLILPGCSKRYHDMPVFSALPFGDYENESVGRFKTGYVIDQLDSFYRGSNPGPIGVTSLVNLDDLYSTSTFGRIYAEQMMSELAMRGFDIVEMRHADAIRFLSDSGEFALSRDKEAVKPSRELGGILVGTYVVSPDRVYVNIRLLDPASSMILSVGSVEMSKTKEIARLLRGGSMPGSLERIPVKHLGYAVTPINHYQQPGRIVDSSFLNPGVGLFESEAVNGKPVREKLPGAAKKEPQKEHFAPDLVGTPEPK